jgi:hypothetical protein
VPPVTDLHRILQGAMDGLGVGRAILAAVIVK